jgi:signal transduction histidine kinase
VVSQVFRTGEPARIDEYGEASGPIAEAVRASGVRSAVATPIVVGNRRWGAMLVGAFGDEPLPPGTETWLGQFTELMATAISNAEARGDLALLVEEQASLRRVATLVAQSVPPAELFSAVSKEIERVFSGVDPTLLASVIRFDPGPECVLVAASRPYELEPVGSRWKPRELYVSTRVLRTGRSARVDEADLEAIGGPDAEVLRLRGFLYQVGTPVVVEGRLWGAISLNSSEELPPDTDERLENFTELIATAIANAESHAALAELADEQAALRRVATLVARNPESDELFSAVAREVAGVLDVRGIIVDRFEADGSQVTLGSWYDLELTGADAFLGVGVRLPLHPGTLAAAVFETHQAARVEDYSKLEGTMGDSARAAGIGSGCAAPIIVDGELWGQMCVFAGVGTVLPAGTEHQLDDFVQLVATAISNYDARANLRMLALEQTALRRVATLVARDAPSEEVFAAVAKEVGKLVDTDITIVGRYDDDGYATVIGNWSASPGGVPVGTRSLIGGRNVLSLVAETGKPARMDAYDEATGEAAEIARRHGWGSSIAAPIAVEGRVWGVMLVATTREEPFPAGSEERLAAFTDLVATALANANVRSQLLESRARIVAAGDEARRRIERNLHDGTQQRLIALGLDIAALRASVPEEQSDLDANLERLEGDVDEVLGEVRELSRGLHPGLLARQGLGPSLRALARRSKLPVELEVDLDERPPEPIETATYFVVSEALTNAVKYAEASYLTVSISVDDSHLHATISDDGVGGAEPGAGAGSGLIGLLDRVNALGGRFELESPRGRGTTISIELPLVQ